MAGDECNQSSQLLKTSANTHAVKLLVSIRNADEAGLAMAAGVGWIDLKEPSQGALGAPDLQTAQRVAQMLLSTPRRSVALGELHEVDIASASELASLFPILKVGLSQVSTGRRQEQHKLQALAQTVMSKNAWLVPVIYADWQRCSGGDPAWVLAQAAKLACPFVLIDTFTKNGESLCQFLSPQPLQRLIDQGHASGLRFVLAGSLTLEALTQITSLPHGSRGIEALGIRGAVCEDKRDGRLCPNKLTTWVEKFANLEFQADANSDRHKLPSSLR